MPAVSLMSALKVPASVLSRSPATPSRPFWLSPATVSLVLCATCSVARQVHDGVLASLASRARARWQQRSCRPHARRLRTTHECSAHDSLRVTGGQEPVKMSQGDARADFGRPSCRQFGNACLAASPTCRPAVSLRLSKLLSGRSRSAVAAPDTRLDLVLLCLPTRCFRL